MINALASFAHRIGEKRFLLLALAPGFLVLAFDVAADHFADQTVEHPAQVSGAIAPVLCALLLVATALPRLGPVWFRRMNGISGGLSLLTGVLGLYFHVAAVLTEMGDEKSWATFLEALTVTPPIFAPAAFAGLGVLLFLLGSPRIGINVAEEAAPSPVPSTAPEAG